MVLKGLCILYWNIGFTLVILNYSILEYPGGATPPPLIENSGRMSIFWGYPKPAAFWACLKINCSKTYAFKWICEKKRFNNFILPKKKPIRFTVVLFEMTLFYFFLSKVSFLSCSLSTSLFPFKTLIFPLHFPLLM